MRRATKQAAARSEQPVVVNVDIPRAAVASVPDVHVHPEIRMPDIHVDATTHFAEHAVDARALVEVAPQVTVQTPSKPIVREVVRDDAGEIVRIVEA